MLEDGSSIVRNYDVALSSLNLVVAEVKKVQPSRLRHSILSRVRLIDHLVHSLGTETRPNSIRYSLGRSHVRQTDFHRFPLKVCLASARDHDQVTPDDDITLSLNWPLPIFEDAMKTKGRSDEVIGCVSEVHFARIKSVDGWGSRRFDKVGCLKRKR